MHNLIRSSNISNSHPPILRKLLQQYRQNQQHVLNVKIVRFSRLFFSMNFSMILSFVIELEVHPLVLLVSMKVHLLHSLLNIIHRIEQSNPRLLLHTHKGNGNLCRDFQ